MSEFDTESFINAVRERPCLWDLSTDDYANRVLKKQTWEELTLLFGGTDCITQKEKSDLCALLQKKWRHIKDSYNREKMKAAAANKSGSGTTRRCPYTYFNLLTFLQTASPPTNTQNSLSIEDPDEVELPEETDIPRRQGPYHPAVLAKKRKPQDDIGKQLINVLKESAEERRKRDSEHLGDEDRMFMMSLVNDFKKIPQHQKLSAKRHILSVIEQHQQVSNLPYSSDVGYNNESHLQQGTQPMVRFPGIGSQLQTQNPTRNHYLELQVPPTTRRASSSTTHSVNSSEYDEDPVSPLLLCFEGVNSG